MKLIWRETRTWFGISRRPPVCHKCHFCIHPGETYLRAVYRISDKEGSRLYVKIEHMYDCDCRPDEEGVEKKGGSIPRKKGAPLQLPNLKRVAAA